MSLPASDVHQLVLGCAIAGRNLGVVASSVPLQNSRLHWLREQHLARPEAKVGHPVPDTWPIEYRLADRP